MNLVIAKLLLAMKDNNSLVCVGLDPDLSKIPLTMKLGYSSEESIYNFLVKVVESTKDKACAYKIQKAFFDLIPNGHILLEEVISMCKIFAPKIPIIVDCKIGDIDNTMNVYLDNIFQKLGADAVVLNPYMGDEVFASMQSYPEKAGIVLVRTSNLGSSSVQDLILDNGSTLWEEILYSLINRWNLKGNLMPILSSTVSNIDYRHVRKLIPDKMPILLAGYGSQGGSSLALPQLLNSQKSGVFINSSRGLLYDPYKGDETNWQFKVSEATEKMRTELNKVRGQNED